MEMRPLTGVIDCTLCHAMLCYATVIYLLDAAGRKREPEASLIHWWLGSLVVRALDSRLDGREFDSRPPRLIVFGRANRLII